jgi:hypothetical protein
MTSLLLWCGPVSADALAGIAWQKPTQIVTFGQGIAGATGGAFSSTAFANLAAWAKQQTPSGDLLDGLLASRQLPLSASYDHIAVAAFSAGHALMNQLLLEDSGKIIAAFAIDACYSDVNLLAKPGYVSFGSRAAQRSRLMVFTASAGGGGPSFSTGSQCARANFNASVQLARVPPVTLAASALGALPPPNAAKDALWARAGDLFLLDYGSQLGHTQHAWQLAKPILEAFLSPYFASGGLLPPSLSAGATGAKLFPGGDVPDPVPQPDDPDLVPEEELPVAPTFTAQRVLTGLGVAAVSILGVVAVRRALAAHAAKSGPGWYALGFRKGAPVKYILSDIELFLGPFGDKPSAKEGADDLRKRNDAGSVRVVHLDRSPW